MNRRRNLSPVRFVAMGTAVLTVTLVVAVAGGRRLSAATAGSTRQISRFATAAFTAASAGGSGAAGPEIPSAAGMAGGVVVDRSNSAGGPTPVGAVSQPHPVTTSTPGLLASFDGLNHFQNRFGSTAGANQFSLEPPDQGLCVGTDGNGNTRVVEALNDVLRVYDTSGDALTPPQALNGFLGYSPAIVRQPLTFGPFVTDPSCLYDAQTGHWFIDVLTLDTFPQLGSDGLEHYTGTNHLDLAVSNTSDPTGSWTIYRLPVQDDGTQGTPNHHCSPGSEKAPPLPTNPTACLGDYPHIGSDTNGVYLTTNEYSFFGPEFHGAQIYAFSKTQLASTPSTISVTQFDTHGLDTFGFALNGFTLWPSTTPGGSGDPTAGGSEYFLSSNAAAEAHDTGDGKSTTHPSTQLLAWALTNTSSLTSTVPSLSLSNTKLDVGLYAAPPAAEQKSGTQPLRDCLNNNRCSTALEGIADPYAEKSASLDSNDTRMQQVTWVNGQLWGALDTALSISSAKQAGVEWFDVAPSTSAGPVSAALSNQGYVGLGNDNLTYPAIGLTGSGTGVMAFTVVGSDFYPSAGYAEVTSAGVGAVHIAAGGAGPDDGFTDYKLFGNPPGTTRPRWGDYGAAVPLGNNIWIASEYIGQRCDLATYERTAFRCGNTRTALANWDTRISEVSAP
jgi:hypothetical protein